MNCVTSPQPTSLSVSVWFYSLLTVLETLNAGFPFLPLTVNRGPSSFLATRSHNKALTTFDGWLNPQAQISLQQSDVKASCV